MLHTRLSGLLTQTSPRRRCAPSSGVALGLLTRCIDALRSLMTAQSSEASCLDICRRCGRRRLPPPPAAAAACRRCRSRCVACFALQRQHISMGSKEKKGKEKKEKKDRKEKKRKREKSGKEKERRSKDKRRRRSSSPSSSSSGSDSGERREGRERGDSASNC